MSQESSLISENYNWAYFYENLCVDTKILPVDLLQFQEDSAEKTEDPTAKRLQDARDRGNIPKSQDLNTAISLLITSLVIYALLNSFYQAVSDMMRKSLLWFDIPNMSKQDFWVFFLDLLSYWFLIMFPIFFIVLLVGMTVQISQVGLHFSTESMVPDLSRFNPVNGFKKILGLRAWAELVKSLIKMVIIGYFPYSTFVSEYPTITSMFHFTIGQDLDYMSWLMIKLIIQVGLVLAIFGIFDFLWEQYRHFQELKMSRKEVQEERKQSEGDPQVKAKIRQKQRELMQNIMSSVPKADVVVTNPTHYAVALSYKPQNGDSAPKVVAKGRDFVAQKIKEIAKENEIPVVENKELARTLFSQVQIDQEIPVDLFQAVATILAEAFKQKAEKQQKESQKNA